MTGIPFDNDFEVAYERSDGVGDTVFPAVAERHPPDVFRLQWFTQLSSLLEQLVEVIGVCTYVRLVLMVADKALLLHRPE